MKKILLYFVVVIVLFFIFSPIKSYASSNINSLAFYQSTSNYEVIQNGDYYSYNLNNKVSNISVSTIPNITVLTNGLGVGASCWSNDGTDDFCFKDDSIINLLSKLCNTRIYWCKYDSYNDINISDITNNGYSDGDLYPLPSSTVHSITSFGCQTIIVLDSDNLNDGFDDTYKEYNYILCSIINDFKNVNNDIFPKINLIGHSRGGLINLKFAMDHCDIVGDVFSIGTPYFGSDIGEKCINLINSNGLKSQLQTFTTNIDLINTSEIISQSFYENMYNRWSTNYNQYFSNINVYAIAGLCSFNSVIQGLLLEIPNISLSNVDIAFIEFLFTLPIGFVDDFSFYLRAQILIDAFALNEGASFSISQYMTNLNFRYYFTSDLLVDYHSQLGAKESLYYNGFNNEILLYDSLYMHTDCVATNSMPAIGHNLETRDKRFIDYVLQNINVYSKSNDTFLFYDISSTDVGIASVINPINSINMTLTIPTTVMVGGVQKNVVEIGEYAFSVYLKNNIDFNTLIIPSSITTIKDSAFEDANFIVTIQCDSQSNLQQIGDYAFANCSSLENVYLPNATNYDRIKSFYNCNLLSSLYTGNEYYVYLNSINCLSSDSITAFQSIGSTNFYALLDSKCEYEINIELLNASKNVLRVYLLNSNFELVSCIDNYELNPNLTFHLYKGAYYLFVQFEEPYASFSLKTHVSDEFSAHTLYLNEQKDLMSHYHNGNSYACFEVEEPDYYYISFQITPYDFVLTQGVIQLFVFDDLIQDYVLLESIYYHQNSIMLYLSIGEYQIIYGQSVYSPTSLKITIQKIISLNDTELDIDECYYNNVYINDFNYKSNDIKKIQYNTYVASLVTIRYNTYSQNSLEVLVLSFNPSLNSYLIIDNQVINSNSIYTFQINPEDDIIYYIMLLNLSYNLNDYINISVAPYISLLLDLSTDQIAAPCGTEVTINNGCNGGLTITQGLSRIIYVKENGIAMSRLNYYFVSSDELVAKVSKYGTVTAIGIFEGLQHNVTITVIDKNNHSKIGYLNFTVFKEIRQNNIYISYGTDLRNSGTISGTEVTDLGLLPINFDYYQIITVHCNYTRLLCFGEDAPSQYLQDYNYYIDINANNTGEAIITQYGTIIGYSTGKVYYLAIYKYNSIYRAYIEIEVV